jgi:hypothetical protein
MDKKLLSIEGLEISSHGIIMDSLEAGPDAYTARRQHYEAIKN